MILVFPVSHVDIRQAVHAAKWMRRLGPYARHDALIAWSSELTPEQKEPLAVEFRAMGWRTPCKGFTAQVHQQGWPEAPNAIFAQCAEMVAIDPTLQRPWYFFEPDNLPVIPAWLDMLEDEYQQDRTKPFLGCVDVTYEVAHHNGELRQIGNHMVGTGIYPPVLRDFTDLHIGCVDAFDIVMSRDIIHLCRHTKLIHNNWRSCHYRWEKGALKSDQAGLLERQFGQALNRDVSPDAVVIHGCKDSSLLHVLSTLHRNPKVLKSQQLGRIVAPKPLELLKTLEKLPNAPKARYGRRLRLSKQPL